MPKKSRNPEKCYRCPTKASKKPCKIVHSLNCGHARVAEGITTPHRNRQLHLPLDGGKTT